jgi:hypothetical protein
MWMVFVSHMGVLINIFGPLLRVLLVIAPVLVVGQGYHHL